MANTLVLCDSCDHYNTATSGYKWQGQVNIGPGRTGNGAIISVPGAAITKNFTLLPTLTCGFAFKTNNLNGTIINIRNARTTSSAKVVLMTDGRCYIDFSGLIAGPTQSSSSSPRFIVDTWYYLEFSVAHSLNVDELEQTLGYILKLNGEIILTGSLTISTHWIGYFPAELGFSSALFYCTSGNSTIFDDIYISTGEFYGDIRIYVIRPNADATPSMWIAHGGGAHYLEVDDVNPDGLNSYLYSQDVDDQDMVHLEDIGISGTIKGIQANYVVQKDEAGDAAFKPIYNFDGTEYVNPVNKYPSLTAWVDFIDPMSENPVTLAQFTIETINAMLMGIKRTV